MDVVNKLWGFCNTLRHDGIDYGDYIEQLTYLLFLKMADEKGVEVPLGCDWASLKGYAGNDLADHYQGLLRHLQKEPGLLGDIFAQAMPRFNNPVNLKRLITMIDEVEWTELGVDVKAEAFEGLLEKAASEGKKGAGQYFTPRVLIQSIVRLMKPDPRVSPDFKVCDPACGTGGFLVAAYQWLLEEAKDSFERKDIKRIKTQTYYGQDLVSRPRRLALMNLFLQGLEPTIYLGDAIYEPEKGERFDCVLSNPPFGTKGANEVPGRDDFTVETSNKQLNFVQHILTTLKPGGRAAIVLPDNCLFEDKAGEVFKIIMQDCNVHTILRLPRGTFTPYSQGVKANVVFLQKGPPTEQVWIFDGRSNVPGVTKKERPLTAQHFAEFEQCYGADPNGRSERQDRGLEGRFRGFSIDEVRERGYKLDITWLKDESLEDADDLPEPDFLASEAITELEAVVDDLRDILALMETDDAEED
ncbi:type I restriction-modification system subunit M [Synechocystis sp. CACIAM 05]|uniref:type I restriction-modification system subunit M n=1 Tax=Synechocystis sp. CACIAM 05 TaxID=1933929 RepID=UPI00138E8706|nr:class I SAM-dependent DNA methyltransferase [Synechocystis sp. CACIAM 05]QHU98939.1 restriction endonuclease subunit S [Synechocystis sp. CACIAM 05]